MNKTAIHQAIETNRQFILDHFFELLRLPTISANPDYREDLNRAAHWLVKYCQNIGFQAQTLPTSGAPVVFAEHCPYPNQPILLIYGHYDVQPVDPLAEWQTSPFEPTIRGDMVYARGASDDKGQFFSFLKALETIYSQTGSLPGNYKIVIEGEEEIGSAHFEELLSSQKELFQADSILIMDAGQFSRGIPALVYGLRGLAYFEITCTGAAFDLHSGQFGGGVPNPAISLIRIINQLKNSQGQITIPGFYQDVQEPEPWEREQMAQLPFQEENLKKELGIRAFQQELNYTPLESMTIRPTFDICGIWGGYTGPGSKTIIPARCSAKISFRLVPNQTPAKVTSLLLDYLKSIVPPDIDYRVDVLPGIEPLITDPHQPIFTSFSQTIETYFGRPPILIRMGGSIGVANLFKRYLAPKSICMNGWGCPDDGIHAPNEHFSITDFFRGIHSTVDFLLEFQDAINRG